MFPYEAQAPFHPILTQVYTALMWMKMARLFYGIGAIKGVGEGPIEAIIEARNKGPVTLRTCSTSVHDLI
ncbi:hypothetical protein O9992_04415 [Vibrio lentus]|nr:hypothetical protein [Vibrio lentus]